MSQISRPFQIALLAVAVIGAAWLFVFQPHPSSTGTSSSSSAVVSTPPATASSTAAAEGKAAGSPSKIYHGSAPGVQGLTRAIARAHEAVATSQQSAKTLEQKSAQASGEAVPGATSASHATSAQPTKTAATPVAKAHHTTPPAAHPRVGVPAGQRSVEAELAQGNVVVVLFWNPNGTDDKAVRRALSSVQTAHHKKIAVNVASASQAATFGAITRGVQIYGTPTMLIVNKHGKAIVLTGLQDAFSIQQAIDEARSVA